MDKNTVWPWPTTLRGWAVSFAGAAAFYLLLVETLLLAEIFK